MEAGRKQRDGGGKWLQSANGINKDQCLSSGEGKGHHVKHSTCPKVDNPTFLQLTPVCDYSEPSPLRLRLGRPAYLSNKRLIKSERESERDRKKREVFKCWLIEELQGIYFLLFHWKVIMPHWRFCFPAEVRVGVFFPHSALPPSYSNLKEEAMARGEPGSPTSRCTSIVALCCCSRWTVTCSTKLYIASLNFQPDISGRGATHVDRLHLLDPHRKARKFLFYFFCCFYSSSTLTETWSLAAHRANWKWN